MSTHLTWETLNDYADGVLVAQKREEAARHLDDCSECHAQLGELRDFLADTQRADRAMDPPADVWPALRADLEHRKVVGMPGTRSASYGATWRGVPTRVRWTLAVAATLLIVASSAVTNIVMRGGSAGTARVGVAPARAQGNAMALEVAQVERGYLESVVELTQALEAARPRLAPATIVIVERNLAVIDAAIAESRAALLQDPGNRVLLDVLAGTYGQKLDLLRRAARLAAS
jgi:anti-sigma factor RsiW